MSAEGVARALNAAKSGARGLRMVGADHLGEREKDDFYPTPPELTRALLAVERFDGGIWEPACGDGAMARVLAAAFHEIGASDLVARGYGQSGVDFLMEQRMFYRCRHIVTNPPFKLATQFWRHACALTALDRDRPGKVAFLVRLTWLEGLERADMFRRFPLSRVWVVPWRAKMQRGRLATKVDAGGMMAWAWFVRDPAHVGLPALGWCPDTREAG